jgi:hypothetical protein
MSNRRDARKKVRERGCPEASCVEREKEGSSNKEAGKNRKEEQREKRMYRPMRLDGRFDELFSPRSLCELSLQVRPPGTANQSDLTGRQVRVV